MYSQGTYICMYVCIVSCISMVWFWLSHSCVMIPLLVLVLVVVVSFIILDSTLLLFAKKPDENHDDASTVLPSIGWPNMFDMSHCMVAMMLLVIDRVLDDERFVAMEEIERKHMSVPLVVANMWDKTHCRVARTILGSDIAMDVLIIEQ